MNQRGAYATMSELVAAREVPLQAVRKSKLKRFWKYRALTLLAVPGLLFLLVNNYFPMFGIFVAFKDLNYAKGIWNSDWIGFDNFRFLFLSNDAYVIIRNTVLYNAVFIAINTILAVFMAVLLNEVKNRFLVKLYQSSMLLPYYVSMVIVGYVVYGFLNPELGFVNKAIIEPMELLGISWYTRPEFWPYILTLVNSWKSIGYLTVFFLAAIVGIDQEYYEAARMDGANRWQQMTRITVPLISPVIIILTLLAIGRIFNADFGLFYQATMGAGAIKPTTDVIDTYVYTALLVTGDTGLASAAGLLQSVVGFILVLSVNFLVRKYSKDNALF
jgi:putative aldouronate transport system permease protein